ncbi:DUF1642 domain-containing protein [Enterococcus gallinarum]|uniref:DUF1642 domain-containing protein n=1 Tax=Enterococcus gallinarum TaxID=1353 RepID=UPI00391D34E5
MNRQELLKELESNKDECLEEARKYEVLSWDRQIVDSKALVYMQVINWVEQLDEKQKVTVPQFLDKYIQENKGDCASDVFSEEWLHDSAAELDDEVDKWLYDNDTAENDRRYLIAVQAFVTGEYKVEKEPLFLMPVPYVPYPVHYCVDEDGKVSYRQGNAQKFTQEELDKHFPEIKRFAVPVPVEEVK